MPKQNLPSPKRSTNKPSARDAFLSTVNDPLRINMNSYSSLDPASGLGTLSNPWSNPIPAAPVLPNSDLTALTKLTSPSPLSGQASQKAPPSSQATPVKPQIVKDRFGFTHVFAPNGKVKIFDQNGQPKTIADIHLAMKRQAPPSEGDRNSFVEAAKTVPSEIYREGANAFNGLTDFFGNTLGNTGDYVGNRLLEGQGYWDNNMDQVRQAQQGERNNIAALNAVGKQVTPGTFMDLASGAGSIAGGDQRTGLHTIATIPARNFQAFKEDPQQWALNFVAVASLGGAGILGKAAALEGESARVAKLGQTALAARYANRAIALRKIGNVMTAKPVTTIVKNGVKSASESVANGARALVQTTSEQVKQRFPTTGNVVHLTDEPGAAGIAVTRKIGSQWNVYGLTEGKVPKSGFQRTVATQARRGLTHEVPMTGRAADLMKPPPFVGLFSLYRRMIGVRQASLGSIDLKTGVLDPTEIFQDKAFRPITRKDMSKYYLHRFIVDYAPDTAINSGIVATGKAIYDNYQNDRRGREFEKPIVLTKNRYPLHR